MHGTVFSSPQPTSSQQWTVICRCDEAKTYNKQHCCVTSNKAALHLQALFRESDPKYVAVHMRFGGLKGEDTFQTNRAGDSFLQSFMTGIACANRMAKANGIALPILLIVDNQEIRQFIVAGNLKNIVSPAFQPVHIDHVQNGSPAQHQGTVIDFYLLSRAYCMVTSPSGFSHHAWLAGGGTACQRVSYNCSSVEGGPGGGPDDGDRYRIQRLPGVPV